jgi:hypothetical protein
MKAFNLKFPLNQLFINILPLVFLMDINSVAQTDIHVKKFGALPGDGMDDSKAILAAIEYAKSNSMHKVRFDAGIYDFKGLAGWETSERGKRSCYISLQDINELEITGAVDAQGKAATFWIKDNDLKEGQPMILSVDHGSHVTMRNIVIDLAPYYYSAGRVISVLENKVTVEVLPGHPYIDGQKAYIMGLYDLEARKAKVLRLTWDSDLPQWRISGAEKDRRMIIEYAALAQSCQVGDGVFWFQGNYTGSLINFSGVRDLLLENVHVLNGHGFPITNNYCHNITYRNVSIKPEQDRIATVCRDGFKLFCPSGKVLMNGLHIEGCLGDDGQNIHGMWLSVAQKRSDKDLLVSSSRNALTPGEEIVLLDDHFHPAWRSKVANCIPEGRDMVITFTDPIPDWVHEKTPVEPQEWLPDSFHVRNSIFRSTGRFGILLKASNTLIENCLFENNVAGIHMGGEWSWGYWLESTNPHHVEIRNCTFRDNHLDMRFGGTKMDMAISIASWTHPDKFGVPSEVLSGLIRDIRIHDNLFENESVCVNLHNCSDVWFWNNTVRNCGTELEIDEKTTENINFTAR